MFFLLVLYTITSDFPPPGKGYWHQQQKGGARRETECEYQSVNIREIRSHSNVSKTERLTSPKVTNDGSVPVHSDTCANDRI